jgi:hypothetical protein
VTAVKGPRRYLRNGAVQWQIFLGVMGEQLA